MIGHIHLLMPHLCRFARHEN